MSAMPRRKPPNYCAPKDGEDLRGVIHCFTGDYDAASAYLDLGFYLSFTGIITFKNAGPLREVVRQVALERMLVETDSPYPHAGAASRQTQRACLRPLCRRDYRQDQRCFAWKR